MRKSTKDPMCSMAKDSVIAAYRAKERELGWYQRLEHLRGRSSAPFATETIDLGEYSRGEDYGETLRGEVFAPFAADGGVMRLVWTSKDHKDFYVRVMGFENWVSDCLHSEKRDFISLGERILAERLKIAIANRRPRTAA